MSIFLGIANRSDLVHNGCMERDLVITHTYERAVRVVKTLREAGHIAYLAGGWVRDYLLNRPSPDIDIATSAPPEAVVALFPHTVQVGVSFGVVMVIIEDEPFEVATFRKDGLYLYGRRPEAVEYSTPEEDAQRRDFTINGMFYDPLNGQIMDFVGGRQDLERGVVRAIGDPHERFREDRLRMVRGVRIMARFHFAMDKQTREAIAAHADSLLPAVAMERLWQEFCKMAEHPGLGRAFVTMHELGLLKTVFPQLAGVPLEEMVQRIHPLRDFPHPCPAILCIAQLFPEATADEMVALCGYMKASNKDAQLVAWYYGVKASETKPNGQPFDAVDWAYLYADSRTDLCLQVVGATLDKERRHHFLVSHQDRQQRLSGAIARLREKKPVVMAHHLTKEGVVPGKKMVAILKEAERISILEGIEVPDLIIAKLKSLPVWLEGSA